MGWSVNDVMPGSDGPENLKILKKSQLQVDRDPCRQTVRLTAIEADSWSWGPTMMLKRWGPTMNLRNWDWTMRCGEHLGVVSIIWLQKTFKNCLSPRAEEPNLEVNKCIHTWTTESPVYLSLSIVFCICVYYSCYWYHWIMVVVCNRMIWKKKPR